MAQFWYRFAAEDTVARTTQQNQTRDPDLEKGAVEGPPTNDSHGNANAPALNEDGLPNDAVAIAEDVIGANEDETQG